MRLIRKKRIKLRKRDLILFISFLVIAILVINIESIEDTPSLLKIMEDKKLSDTNYISIGWGTSIVGAQSYNIYIEKHFEFTLLGKILIITAMLIIVGIIILWEPVVKFFTSSNR